MNDLGQPRRNQGPGLVLGDTMRCQKSRVNAPKVISAIVCVRQTARATKPQFCCFLKRTKKKKKMPENVRAQIHMLVFGCCHYSSVHPEIVAPHPSNFLRKQLFDFSSESNFLASFVLRRRPRRHFPPYRNGTITPPVHDRFIPNVMYSLLAPSHTQNSLDYDFSTFLFPLPNLTAAASLHPHP